jgi:N-acyl-D-amino-acid deacylase
MAVMGDASLRPTVTQQDSMRRMVDDAMTSGAHGLSTGLIYSPGCFADTDELIALSRVAADHEGIYVTHVRGETASLIDSAINEALTISRTAGLPLQISHLKVIGRRMEDHNRINSVLDGIDNARAGGMDIGFDCYPYTRGSTLLSALIPRWAHEGGVTGLLDRLACPTQRKKIIDAIEADDYGGENWLKVCGFESVKVGSVTRSSHQPYVGLNLVEIGDKRKQHPYDALFDLLLESEANIIMVFSMLSNEDMHAVITHPSAMVGTDAIPCPPGTGQPHPRGYGSFPKVLGRLARTQGLMSLEAAIHKMTAGPAKRFGLEGRGVIAEGMWADMVIFDGRSIMDTATYENPRRHPEGIHYVFVNGRLALDHGRIINTDSGRFI